MTALVRTLLAASACLASCAVGAATISGVVRDAGGKPVANAFVTATDAARGRADTVLSDAAGRWRIDQLFPGTYALRARKAGHADGTVEGVPLTELDATKDITLAAEDAAHLALPGSAWLNALPNEPMKATFVTSCTICHDQGSPIVRGPRDAAGWRAIIQQMRSQADVYSVIVKMDDSALADWLAAHRFGAEPKPYDLFAKGAGVATGERLTEYEVGDATSWAHDMAVDPGTGAAFVGDYVRDELVRVDPLTGAKKVYPSPVRGTGMHTLNFSRDGRLWITFQLADVVASFDPKAEQWRIYPGFAKGTLVHSFALDSSGFVKTDAKGRILVSQFGGNRVSFLDPATGRITEVMLPGDKSGRPYGIALDGRGRAWYTKYSENLMGWVDPATGEGKEWALPRADSGPHRMHIDDQDRLWIPLSGFGTLLRYDTRTGEQKEYALPDPDTFPYVARYDAKSDRVWIAANGANSIYALDPKSGRFTTFRLPSYLSYGRMISIDYATGDVWTALSSYPNKHALRNHGLLLRIRNALSLVN
jgi:virginiamycin B lyase